MAKICVNCNNKIGWGDGVKLIDGFVCTDCYHLSGMYDVRKAEHVSTENMLRMIQKLDTLDVIAEEKIRQKWEEIAAKYGWNEETEIIANDLAIWIHDGCLNEIKTYSSYFAGDCHGYWLKSICNTSQKLESFLAKLKPVECLSIPIANIQYFAKEGDVQYTTKISGGGGGGSSISGAIVGGILAGDTGAVIGSRQKIAEIESRTEKHDSRRTILRYYEGDSVLVKYYDGFEMYDLLLQLIPEKDLLTIQLQGSNQNTTSVENSNTLLKPETVRERLKALKSMFEEDLIDQTEYAEKKQELLRLL